MIHTGRIYGLVVSRGKIRRSLTCAVACTFFAVSAAGADIIYIGTPGETVAVESLVRGMKEAGAGYAGGSRPGFEG